MKLLSISYDHIHMYIHIHWRLNAREILQSDSHQQKPCDINTDNRYVVVMQYRILFVGGGEGEGGVTVLSYFENALKGGTYIE